MCPSDRFLLGPDRLFNFRENATLIAPKVGHLLTGQMLAIRAALTCLKNKVINVL